MNKTQELLSDIVVYNKYAKYIPELKRRETWDEIITRYLGMMTKKYPDLSEEINTKGQFLFNKKVLPSMRALQFAGNAIEKNEARGYNCSYLPMSDHRSFSELMFLLLGGTGVGYSVQFHHIEELPEIIKPFKESKYLIGDSIEGWADAVKQLMKAYFGKTKVKPRFDYTDIRAKGSRLVTAGGKAPGPGPLKICLTKIEVLLNQKENGDRLSSFEAHRICCLIADAVLAGGIRRAALISLFSFDDEVMTTCKHGSWWEKYPELGRANNSATILRNRVKKEEFDTLWEMVVDSNSGEPGVYFTNDPEYGTNPCCEISLRPFTFCNLTEINAGNVGLWEESIKDNPILEGVEESALDQDTWRELRQIDFNNRAEVAAFFGTLQAGFTDFHYLRSIWQKNTEKDSLIGVGITGIANNTILDLNLQETVEITRAENNRVANIIGIPCAARVTTVKPSGTTSCVVGTSSGIHAWHSKFYIRNIQCRIGDDLFNFFANHHPELIKIMDYDPNSAVIGIPQEAPEGAILRGNENALDLLERTKKFNLEWVKEGHVRGPNTNNVSATISINKDTVYGIDENNKGTIVKNGAKIPNSWINEWEMTGNWMWDNKSNFNGLSVLPADNGSYKDAPFEVVSRERFDYLLKYIQDNPIDLTKIVEEEDGTNLAGEAACQGGACEVV